LKQRDKASLLGKAEMSPYQKEGAHGTGEQRGESNPSLTQVFEYCYYSWG